jgi:hypothetical protein
MQRAVTQPGNPKYGVASVPRDPEVIPRPQPELVTDTTEVEDGVDTAGQQSPEIARPEVNLDALFGSYFSSYVAIADGPEKIQSVIGRDPNTKAPIFDYFDRELVAEARLKELRLYITVALKENTLSLDPALIMNKGPVTLAAYVERYIERGILKARLHAHARGKLAAHVTEGTVDNDPVTTHSFWETVKGLAKSAMGAKDSVVHYHSGEIPKQTTKAIPLEELKEIVRVNK